MTEKGIALEIETTLELAGELGTGSMVRTHYFNKATGK